MAMLAPSLSGGRSGPGRAPLAASVALHLLVVTAFVASAFRAEEPLPELIVYRVDLVSPPPQVQAPAPQPVQAPEPRVVQPERTVTERPQPAERPQPTAKPPVQEEPKEEPKPAAGPRPDPAQAESGEDLNIKITGEDFPFPEYLNNITVQIRRYFRWAGAQGLSANVYFVILREGSVQDLRVLRGSGNFRFDLEALGAIEQAGQRGAFGPLPDGFGNDRLPVAFEFIPPR